MPHLKESKKVGDIEEREMEETEYNIDVAESCPTEYLHVYDMENR